jgi:hypothetical protein
VKKPGFKPLLSNLKTWFQAFAFKPGFKPLLFQIQRVVPLRRGDEHVSGSEVDGQRAGLFDPGVGEEKRGEQLAGGRGGAVDKSNAVDP